MLKKYKDSIRDILIIFVLSLTPLLWFRPGMLMVGHDNVAPLDPKVFLEGRLSTWSDQFFGQSQALILGTIPIHALDAIPSLLGFSVQDSQKIVFVLWFFLIGISAYTLAHVLQARRFEFKLVASTIYQFNFFIFQGWWIAEKSKFSAYVALPLVLSAFFLTTSNRLAPLVGAALTSFILFLFNAGGIFGIPLYGGLFVTLGSFTTVYFVYYLLRKNYTKIRRLTVFLLSSLFLTLATNAYYLLPAGAKLSSQFRTGIERIGGASGVLSWAAEISANTSFVNLMRLQGIPEWYDNPEHPYAKLFIENPLLIAASFLFPLLVFGAVYRVRKYELRKFVFLFLLVYVLGLFFTAGTHPPLGFLYQFLIEKVPGFVIFRTPYFKFAPALILSTAFLIGFFIDSLSERIRRFSFLLLFAFVLAYHFPYFSGNFFQWRERFSTRLTVPNYVFSFAHWVKNEKRDSRRILLLPPNSSDVQYSMYQWGYLSFQALPTLFGDTRVVVNNDKLELAEQTLVTALYRAIADGDSLRITRLSSLLSIGYVVIQHDVFTNIKSSLPLDPLVYARAIGKSSLFTPVRKFDQWEVYALRGDATEEIVAYDRAQPFDGTIEDVSSALSFFNVHNNLILETDRQSFADFDKGLPEMIMASCINCPRRSKPFIQFPQRNILPDSPLYPFVLLSEQRTKPTDAKSAIYHELGITLKRISEISELIMHEKALTKEVVDRYKKNLRSIQDNFNRIETPKDRIEVSTDILYYLRAQRTYLRPTLNNYLVAGPQTVQVGFLFTAIYEAEQFFMTFATPIGETRSRWYQFNVHEQGEFDIVYEAKAQQLLGDVRDVSLDGTKTQGILDLVQPVPGWISIGRFSLTTGYHTLKITLPDTSVSTLPFGLMRTEFSTPENVCFGTTMPNIQISKLYKVNLTFENNFSDNLLFFVWEKNKNARNLVSAIKLPAGPVTEKREDIFEPSSGTEELEIAVCAPNITAELADRQFRLEIAEVLYPLVFLKPVRQQEATVLPVEFHRLSPTNYEVKLPEGNRPLLLAFSTRYDPWWKLEGYEKMHVRVNGYANGWFIHPNSSTTVKLEYEGQRYFRWGVWISIIGILTDAFVMARYIKRKRYYGRK